MTPRSLQKPQWPHAAPAPWFAPGSCNRQYQTHNQPRGRIWPTRRPVSFVARAVAWRRARRGPALRRAPQTWVRLRLPPPSSPGATILLRIEEFPRGDVLSRTWACVAQSWEHDASRGMRTSSPAPAPVSRGNGRSCSLFPCRMRTCATHPHLERGPGSCLLEHAHSRTGRAVQGGRHGSGTRPRGPPPPRRAAFRRAWSRVRVIPLSDEGSRRR